MVRVVGSPHEAIDADLVTDVDIRRRTISETPTWQLRRKYSDGESCNASTARWYSGYAVVPLIFPIRTRPSRRRRSAAIHAHPVSVNTNCRSGKRSNTPPNMRCPRPRWKNRCVSLAPTAMAAGPDSGVSGGADRDRMAVHRHADVAAGRPERIEGAFVQVDEVAHVIRRDQHAGQSRRLGPTHLGDGVVEVAQEHLRHPGTPPGRLGAEVDHPTVVCLYPRPPVAVLLLGRWRRRRDGARRIEGRHRVREEHLGDDALALEMLHAACRCPSCRASEPTRRRSG